MKKKKLRRKNFWDWQQITELFLENISDLESTFRKCKMHDHKKNLLMIAEFRSCLSRVLADKYLDEIEKTWSASLQKQYRAYMKKPFEMEGENFRCLDMPKPLDKMFAKAILKADQLLEKDWERALEILSAHARGWWC